MPVVRCVKCNFSTIILLKQHHGFACRVRDDGRTVWQRPKIGFNPLGARTTRHQAQLGTVAAIAPRLQRSMPELAESRTAYTTLLSDNGVAAIPFQQLVGLDPLIRREANELYRVART